MLVDDMPIPESPTMGVSTKMTADGQATWMARHSADSDRDSAIKTADEHTERSRDKPFCLYVYHSTLLLSYG